MLKELISTAQLRHRVAELGDEITDDYRNETDLVLLCILKGSIYFTTDLSRAIRVDHELEFLQVSSYGNEKVSSNEIKFVTELGDMTGKSVIIIEDIVDTGQTIQKVVEYVKSKNAKSVEVCTCLYKPSKDVVKSPLKYVGFEVDNLFIVGYGLDLEQKKRNISNIRYFVED